MLRGEAICQGRDRKQDSNLWLCYGCSQPPCPTTHQREQKMARTTWPEYRGITPTVPSPGGWGTYHSSPCHPPSPTTTVALQWSWTWQAAHGGLSQPSTHPQRTPSRMRDLAPIPDACFPSLEKPRGLFSRLPCSYQGSQMTQFGFMKEKVTAAVGRGVGRVGQVFIFPMKKDRCGWICHPLPCCSCSDNGPHVYGCGGHHETMRGQTSSNSGGAKRKKLKSLGISQKCRTHLGLPTWGFLLSEENELSLLELLQSWTSCCLYQKHS